jgi:hypothetical protein
MSGPILAPELKKHPILGDERNKKCLPWAWVVLDRQMITGAPDF